jgi:hypothetical protein
MSKEKCCVCGKRATHYHLSIIGSLRFWLCEKHYKNTSSAIGNDGEFNRMGLVDKDTRNWINLKHWK